MNKRFVPCLLFLIFFVVGCSKTKERQKRFSDTWMEENGKCKILSTTAMIGNLVREIGGELIDHMTLIEGELDPHSYELVKGDSEKLQRADLIFYNGLGLEHGASLLYYLTHSEHAIPLGDRIEKREPHRILMEGGQKDPHIWMDLSLWAETIDPIVEELSHMIPEYRRDFEERGEELKRKLYVSDTQVQQMMQKIPENKRYLVTSHDAFNYFTYRYLATSPEQEDGSWKLRFLAPEGLAPDAQMSILDIKKVIEHLCLLKISVIFPESNLSQDALKKIFNVCSRKGHKVRIAKTALYGDSMGELAHEDRGYLLMMFHNAKTIYQELMNEEE